MKIYTYYQDINFSNQRELIDLWKISWSRHGYEPIVLNLEDAKKHPYFETLNSEIRRIFKEITGKQINDYGMSCWFRWLAYANQKEEVFYVSDYDAINLNFPTTEPSNKLHLMDDWVPFLASGTPNQFENLCKAFVEVSNQRVDILKKDAAHYHDQEFFYYNLMPKQNDMAGELRNKYNILMTRDRTRFGGADINSNALVHHVSHNMVNVTLKTKSPNKKYSERERIIIVRDLLKLGNRHEPNQNIFQICINLNDNIQELQLAKANLVNKNPDYTYHYITNEQAMLDMMQKAFRDSNDAFDQEVYKSYLLVDGKLAFGSKAQQMKDPIQKDRQYAINVLVSRTDIFRYAMLYKYGGLYCDLSSIADTDINRDLSMYDFYAVRSKDEVKSLILYRKKQKTICRLVLESIISACNKLTPEKSLTQYRYAGPGCLTDVLISVSNIANIVDKKEKIASINIDHYNSHIEDEKSCAYFRMRAPWKKQLHQPDPDNQDRVINSHWFLDY